MACCRDILRVFQPVSEEADLEPHLRPDNKDTVRDAISSPVLSLSRRASARQRPRCDEFVDSIARVAVEPNSGQTVVGMSVHLRGKSRYCRLAPSSCSPDRRDFLNAAEQLTIEDLGHRFHRKPSTIGLFKRTGRTFVMVSFDLDGRVAFITGGNGGIGLGMAKGLADAGAGIVIAARNQEKAQSAIAELVALGARAEFVPLDILDETSCRTAISVALERFGRLDILINNAGTTVRKQPQDLTTAEWRRVVETNLTGAFVCAQAAYPALARRGGKVINIGSMLSIFGAGYAAPYAASKGGIVQMTRALATAWAKDNIQVNAVLPGWIDTELTRAARQQVEGLHERVLARTPAGRWGDPSDFAGIAVFLASSASDFVTGAAIPIDGGYSIQG